MALDVIEAAVRYLQMQTVEKPVPADVIAALIEAEKQSKQAKQRYRYEQLVGSWRLGLVSGTQKASARAEKKSLTKPVKKPGAGRFLPRFINIAITYAESEPLSLLGPAIHTVTNTVALGPLQLKLTGPTRFANRTASRLTLPKFRQS